MNAPVDLSGPIDGVLDRVAKHFLARMPRNFSGHSLDAASISLHQDEGLAVYSWRDGFKAAAPAQVIGLYLDAEGEEPGIVTWQWVWSNQLFRPELGRHAAVLRAYGETNNVAEIRAAELEGRMERCWGFAMLAAVLNGVDTVVGVPGNNAMIVITAGPFRAA